MNNKLINILIFTFILSLSCTVSAETKSRKWDIKADEVVSQNVESGEYVLDGNIEISNGLLTVKADFVIFNSFTQKVFARGNVSLKTKDKGRVEGTSIEFDLNKQTGVIYNGLLFIKEKHFYIRGRKIEKISEDTYKIDDVSVTTCDDEVPDWKITARKLSVTVEGYGYLTHSKFWVKNVPVFYFPGAVFPAKIKRQTGLLFPYFEASDSNGFTYMQPVYFALGRSYDLTYYNNIMNKKGFMPGVQGRYAAGKNSKGTFFYNYLKDNEINTSYTNIDEKRYWIRGKVRQSLPFGITLNTDLDIVSDKYYLTDFKDDKHTGYDDTNSYYEENFGSSLDNYSDSERQNSLSVKKSWSKFSLDMKFNWLDNVSVKNSDSSNTSLHQLPYIQFKGLKQKLFDSSIYYQFQTRYDNFYRIDTDADNQRGHRGDLYYKVSYPGSLGVLNIEPYFAMRQTSWNTTYEGSSWQSHDRTIYYGGLSTSTEIYRIFGDVKKSAFKHSLKPEISLSYIDDTKNESYPSFDSIDTISDEKKVTYSLTNTFTSKSVMDKGGASYNQFVRFKVSQSYDYLIEKNDGEEPFSDISFELKITPKDYFSLSYDFDYSAYSDQFNTSNMKGSVRYKNLFKMSVEHRFTRADADNDVDRSELLLISSDANLGDKVTLFYNYEKDLYNDQTNKVEIGGIYKSQCWELTLKYLEEDSDQKFLIYLQLTGLGTIDHKETKDW